MSTTSLQEITGHEAGAVVWPGGHIWIGNWTQVSGLPRLFGTTAVIGLGEPLTAQRCRVPEEARQAMQAHELAQDTPVNARGYQAWNINDGEAIVVINDHWN